MTFTEYDDNALRELGQIAAERRESIGMTLETVYDRTKIRLEYLQGIEEGDYTNFPEVVYIKGFVRTYLKIIGAEDLQDEFMTQLNKLEPPDNFPGSVSSSRQHEDSRRRGQSQSQRNISRVLGNGSSLSNGFKPASHFWLFLVLIFALVGTGVYVWYAVKYEGLDLRNMKFFSFSGTNTLFNDPNALSNDVNTGTNTEPVSVPVSDDVTVQVQEQEKPEVKPSIEIHAVNDVWLSVRFGDAQPVFRRTLKRGDFMRWDLNENEPARVVFGRPAAAQVILNGKDLGVVNPSAKRSETYIYNADGTFQNAKKK
ncbi:MAG: DUF4115 domain-containing protein [Synergistaceae bacterium]|nr:DUF4115 domain-containing protein [Synergistaceae bacterium]MBQ9404737.1 DUF4115 domain-containing protein [Synergistaceae bacterium]MBQ9595125.1 DUF4115 domain-containing protein [Synergistaceae bacterium]MBR0204885.1 DUF4115 domain-containing protein [Synergistaceae bacterium]